MVLKRRVLQSLFDFDLATEIRQDPAVCVSLPSNSIVKEQNSRTQTRPAAYRRIFETTKFPPDVPVRNHRVSRVSCPARAAKPLGPPTRSV
jgi:hypothetical protein